MNGLPRSGQGTARARSVIVLPLLSFAFIVGIYFTSRYGMQWADGDTSILTKAIEAIRQQNTLLPHEGTVYSHGFAYQAVSLMMVSLTGLPVDRLQAVFWPMMAPLLLALGAFAFYTRVAKDRLVAALSVVLLFFQGDVLFVTLRGSHEKLGWPLMLVALMLLGLSTSLSFGKMALCIVLFYLLVFGLAATNSFFASVFVVAVGLSFLIGLAVARIQGLQLSAEVRRLTYVVVSCAVLVFAFTVYVYPPAVANLRLLRTIADQVSALFLSFEASGQPYQYISLGWTSTRVYFGLTGFTWLLIAASFAAWLVRGWHILKGREPLHLPESLDWLLYAGFAIQLGVSVIMDLSGVLAQNMQLRIFPAFTVMAAVLIGRALARAVAALRRHVVARRAVLGVATLAAAWFAVAAILKATNEPVLSNKWTFYAKTEVQGLSWADSHLQSAALWTGIDERLSAAFDFVAPGRVNRDNRYDAFALKPDTRFVFISERERLRATRAGMVMPSVLGWDRVYDNGEATFSHRRPVTTFQR